MGARQPPGNGNLAIPLFLEKASSKTAHVSNDTFHN